LEQVVLHERIAHSDLKWRRLQRLRPTTLAVFSYHHDIGLVPDLLANLAPMVDGWVAYDDRRSPAAFSNEPRRRALLIDRARELGATWVLAVDPDERFERGLATAIRLFTRERQRIVWQFNLREMFSLGEYRIDGIWGVKSQGRLFPVFDGTFCSEAPVHGAWFEHIPGYSFLSTGFNLYHLKMINPERRAARRDLYSRLDPKQKYQSVGYDYLLDESRMELDAIPRGRDFLPCHTEETDRSLFKSSGSERSEAQSLPAAVTEPAWSAQDAPSRTTSQLGQAKISVGRLHASESELAVVVIGLGAPDSLKDAVASLREQCPSPEIIVVNSGGGDAAGLLAEHLDDIMLIELEESVLVGAARNLGIKAACAPYIAFLAGDCRAEPGWVSARIEVHREGAPAVASVLTNSHPQNPIAGAAHLMTYGRRMPGVEQAQSALFGASYDRDLFEQYGLFSEALRVGEDSEFHKRFRPPHQVRLVETVRTRHANPTSLLGLFKDQYARGKNARYLADFFRRRFTLGYVFRNAAQRFARALRLSVRPVDRPDRFYELAAWPFIVVGTLAFLAGMLVSYVRAILAESAYGASRRLAVVGDPHAAIGKIRRALALRPITARYQFQLASLVLETGQIDSGSREIYLGFDMTREPVRNCYRLGPATRFSPGAARGRSAPRVKPAFLTIVVIAGNDLLRTAGILNSLASQIRSRSQAEIVVVNKRGKRSRHLYSAFAARWPSLRVTIAAPSGLAEILGARAQEEAGSDDDFVVITTDDHQLPPDWLAWLDAYIANSPEVDFFYGETTPPANKRAGALARAWSRVELQSRLIKRPHGLAGAAFGNWACRTATLPYWGGWPSKQVSFDNAWTLTNRILKAGACALKAQEWQSAHLPDFGARSRLARFFREGYLSGQHVAGTSDPEALALVFEGGRSLSGSWRRSAGLAAGCWQASANEHASLAERGLAVGVAFACACAREAGLFTGVRRTEHALGQRVPARTQPNAISPRNPSAA
jgi:glycosyltransferase involved in cell wall biosynthesis